MTRPRLTQRLLLLLVLLTSTACGSYPKQLPETQPDEGTRFVRFSRAVVWPIEIELAKPSYVSVFLLGRTVEMQSPLVPVSKLEEIYGAWLGPIENDDLNTFRIRHPWAHPDSVPDPFVDAPPPLDAGRHELERPFAPYIIQELNSPLPCEYWVLITSDDEPDFEGLFALESARLPRSPEESAERIVQALGFDLEGGGWTAVIQQGDC